jgi:hypothetical protein
MPEEPPAEENVAQEPEDELAQAEEQFEDAEETRESAMSVTFKLKKKRNGRELPRDLGLSVVQALVHQLHTVCFVEWLDTGLITQAVCGVELGEKNRKPHGQAGFMWVTRLASDTAAAQELKAFLEANTPLDAQYQWTVHVVPHDDWRFLVGYCCKDRDQYHYRRAVIGISAERLDECFEYYLSVAGDSRDGADKLPRRFGEEYLTLLIKRTNVEVMAAWFVYRWKLGVLRATLERIVGWMIESGRYSFAAHWASNETLTPVRSNALHFVKDSPSLGANIHLMRIIMYGENYHTFGSVAEILGPHLPGPPVEMVDSLTFAEAQLAARSGIFPDRLGGGHLEAALGNQYIGRIVVIDLRMQDNGRSSALVQEVIASRLLVPNGILFPHGGAGQTLYLAVATARLLAKLGPAATTITASDAIARVNRPSCIEMLNRVVGIPSDQPQQLNPDQMAQLLTEPMAEGDQVEYPWMQWMYTPEASNVHAWPPAVVPATQLNAHLQNICSTYEPRGAKLHIIIIQEGSHHFTIGLQLGVAHMNVLRGQREDAALDAALAVHQY